MQSNQRTNWQCDWINGQVYRFKQISIACQFPILGQSFYWNKQDSLKLYVSGNINWRDVNRKIVVNNVDMSSLRAPRQNGSLTSQHKEQKT